MDITTDVSKLRKATKVVKEGEDITHCVNDLFNELKTHECVGLSANQVGHKHRILIMKMPTGPPVCIVNPQIVKERGSEVKTETCLSLPGKKVPIKRPRQIVVKGLNRYFKPVRYRLGGLQARIVCHEVDLLNGKLIIDYEVKGGKTQEGTQESSPGRKGRGIQGRTPG